jgi:hypothetical protein
VVDQAFVVGPAPGVQRLLQRVEHEVGARRTGHLPADDAAGEHVDHERHVDESGPGRDVGEIADPQRVRALGPELPVDLPGRRPRSRSACRTQRRSVSAVQPNLALIELIAAHCELCSDRCSQTIRTARS